MRKLKLALMILALSVSSCFAEPLIIKDSGLKLSVAEKQEYIAGVMANFFKPNANAKPYKFAAPDGWTLESFKLDDLKIERLKNNNENKTQRVILELHGGGYVMGLTENHKLLGAKQGVLINAAEVYYVDYRLAPAHVYPAALDDAVKAYKYLLENKVKPENIIVIGDSAGGNLALALALYLRDNKIAMPGALALISPWGTFAQDLNSRVKNAERDLVLGVNNKNLYTEVQAKRPSYAGDLDLKDPKLSPIYADMTGLSPMLIQVGGYELFTDDGLELFKRALECEVQASLSVYPGMPHDFPLLFGELDDTAKALYEFRDFVNRIIK